MGLTAAEQAELAQLEKEVGSGLSVSEAQELAQLEAELGQPQEKIVNEMHEGFKGRFVYKNFGADPVASFNYLQKENPDFEIKHDKSGEIIARKRGTEAWGRMDPKGFDWRDLTDVGYDVPAGVAQGAATAASGLAGAVGSPYALGLGGIPAAMAGSAASGTALEGLRQGIGSYFIDDNLSGQDLGIAAASGAVSPLLFGTGAGLKEAGKFALKQAGKEGVKQTAEEILATQRGLMGRGYDVTAGYLGPKLANLAGGENVKVIKKAAGMLPELKDADTMTNVSVVPLKKAAEEVPKKLREVTQATGKRMTEIRNMIDDQPGLVVAGQKAPGSIDAKPFVQPFLDLVDNLEKTASGDADKEAVAELKKLFQKEFSGMDEFMTAAQVDAKAQKFKGLAKEYGINYGKSGTTQSTSLAGVSGRVGDAFESARRKMNEAIIERLEAMDPNLSKEYVGAKESYSKLLKVAKENETNFKSPTNVKNFLNRAMNDPSDVAANQLEEIQKLTGVDLEDLAVRSQALKVFSKPETEIRSLAKSVTPRQLALGAATGALGYYGAQQSGNEGMSPFLTAVMAGALGSKAASPAMLRKYMEANKLMRSAPANLPGYKALPYLMMNPNLHDQGEK